MKEAKEVNPNYAPVYAAALYPELARLFVDNGYALAVHGSLARDFDLIAVPWGKKVTNPKKMLKIMKSKFTVDLIGGFERKKHGRIAQTVSIGYGQCAIDLSFIPTNHL